MTLPNMPTDGKLMLWGAGVAVAAGAAVSRKWLARIMNGPSVSEVFADAAKTNAEQLRACQASRDELMARLTESRVAAATATAQFQAAERHIARLKELLERKIDGDGA